MARSVMGERALALFIPLGRACGKRHIYAHCRHSHETILLSGRPKTVSVSLSRDNVRRLPHLSKNAEATSTATYPPHPSPREGFLFLFPFDYRERALQATALNLRR
jgi:hypothetical protein